MSRESEVVFKALCEASQNWYGAYVYSAKYLADRTHMSRSKTIKALHELRDQKLVKRDSMGCPAIESRGEYVEGVCDSAPPINGWSVTEKGRDTRAYKKAVEEYKKGLSEWANGGSE